MYSIKENRRATFAMVTVGLSLLLVLPFVLSGLFAVTAAGPTVTNTNHSGALEVVTAPSTPTPAPLPAATIIVNSTGEADNIGPAPLCDTNPGPAQTCTLRAAIQAANADPGDDIIRFDIPLTQPNCDAGTGNCIINLEKALPELSTNMSIEGPGADKLSVRRDSAPEYRIFTITAAGTVTISGLTIRNGNAGVSNNGGAIANSAGTLNLINSTIESNTAGIGGGFSNAAGTVNITGTTFNVNSCSSHSGGAISNSGTINLTQSTVTGNLCQGVDPAGDPRRGGGIANNIAGILNIADSTIVNNSGSAGGGISNTGKVTVTDSRLGANSASTDDGGGLFNSGNGTADIVNSSLLLNTANQSGAGVFNVDTGSVTVTNSLIDGADASQSGIFNQSGNLKVSNSTITRNGTGLVNGTSGTSTVKSTIIAGNLNFDASGSFTSAGFNLIGKSVGSTGFDQPADQKGTSAAPLDPRLEAVFDASSTTFIYIPRCNSPAIDRASSVALTGTLTTDRRGAGFARTVDDPAMPNAAGGDGTDVGAIERQSACTTFTLVVNTTADAADANPGDTVCDSDATAGGSQCSLRAAMTEAETLTATQIINFAIPPSDPGFDSATGRHTINLTGQLPEILNADLVINGPGADKLTVRRSTGGFYGIFKFGQASGNDVTVTVSGLTISNGFSTADGGGISIDGGTLTVTGCTFTDNAAAASGGGIAARGTMLTVNGSTFLRNFAAASFNNTFIFPSGGGGIACSGRVIGTNITREISITNSTFRDNGTSGVGGGVATHSSIASITNSEFNGNEARGGGISNESGDLNITNCQIMGNRDDERGAAGIASDGGLVNIIGSTVNSNFGFYGISHLQGTLNITSSAVSGNSGIGIFNGSPGTTDSAGPLNITNSTISGNTEDGIAHAIGVLNVTNTTISNNGGYGIDILVQAQPPAGKNVKSTIIALNQSGFGDIDGAFTSGGFNLIGDPGTNSSGFTNGVNNDQVGTTAAPLDPKLDPLGLQNNGGPTSTIALLSTSPAIDKGTAAGITGTLTTDQRGTGYTRTFDDPSVVNAADGTDIGAFELNPAAPSPTPTPTPSSSPTPSPSPSPSPTPNVPTFGFDAPVYTAEEGVRSLNIRIVRSGPTGISAAVDLTSEDGTAKQNGDYTFAVGHLSFAAGETEKTFQVLINDDSYSEGLEFANLILQHPENGTLGLISSAMLQITDNVSENSANPIDDPRTFASTHYHDFLYRQADQSGEDFWTQQIEQCATEACRESKRADVSTAFFLSIEFQQTGYLVIRAHKAAFGDLKSNPRYEVFLRDQRAIGEGVIVGQPGFEQVLNANRQKFLEDFVTRPEFVALFPQGASAVGYVDLLFGNAGASPTQSERDAAIAAYGSGDTAGRAAALRSVFESGSVFNAQYNPAFVLMQYYGYLRRNPDDAPDNNFIGYDFWLAKMNSFTFPGEDARDESVALARVRRAEMVKAFIQATEYRQRFFGSPAGNQEGSAVSAEGGP